MKLVNRNLRRPNHDQTITRQRSQTCAGAKRGAPGSFFQSSSRGSGMGKAYLPQGGSSPRPLGAYPNNPGGLYQPGIAVLAFFLRPPFFGGLMNQDLVADEWRIPDDLWAEIAMHLPPHVNTHRFGGGRPRAADRVCMDAIFFV